MFKEKFKSSISFRFLSITCIILIIGTLGLSTVIAINEQRILKNSLLTQGQSLASLIARQSGDSLVLKDYQQLDALVNDLHRQDVAYAVIRDEQGVILTSQFASINYRSSRLNGILSGLPRDSWLQDIILGIKKMEPVIEISAPIEVGLERVGKVTIGMLEYRVNQEITHTILSVITLNIAVALVLTIMLFVASRKMILRPIAELSRATRALAGGDLSNRVEVKTIGEVKLLADRFNQMLDSLEKVTVSKDFVDSIIKSIIDTLIVLSPDRNIIMTNAATVALLGYEEKELIGKPFSMILDGGDATGEAIIGAVRSKGVISSLETKYLTKDGIKVSMLFSGSAMSVKNRTNGILCVARDITEFKKAEEAIAAEKERLAVTLRSIGDAVIVTDIEGSITLMNKVAEELTGWTGDVCIGKPLSEIFIILNENTRERCENPVDKVRSTGLIVGLANHSVLIRKDGTEMIIADSAAPIRDMESKIIGFVLVFRDITVQCKTDAELQKMQKLESLGILAGGLAHDFNNLLTGIIGNVGLAKMQVGKEHKAYDHLTKAEGATERAASLTQQLLTFAKGGEPIKRKTDIAAVVKESVGFALHGSQVRCEYMIPAELWNTEVDSGQMAQVFNNLIINALHAMPYGGTVHISFENISLAEDQIPTLTYGDYVKIEFRDEGTGIAEEHLSRIFDPYFTTKKQGSGLGLATVFSIINRHGGYITVESTVGRGTTFYIYLPATRDTSHDGYQEIGRVSLGQGRILVMDDEAIVRETAGAILAALGYEVAFTDDGTKLIKLYKRAIDEKRPFNIVIMDLTIPGGMGGKETVKRLLEIDADAKVIVSSGYSTDPIMSNYKEYGFKGVITKPYNIAQVSKAISRVLAI
jgi:PAS domain S-box-containing protein